MTLRISLRTSFRKLPRRSGCDFNCCIPGAGLFRYCYCLRHTYCLNRRVTESLFRF